MARLNVVPDQPLTIDDHITRATQYAGIAVEHGHHGLADSQLAWATTARVHATLAQVLTAREALAAAHAPVDPETVPGATLARIHTALADATTERPP